MLENQICEPILLLGLLSQYLSGEDSTFFQKDNRQIALLIGNYTFIPILHCIVTKS